jgi:hypothetical protein
MHKSRPAKVGSYYFQKDSVIYLFSRRPLVNKNNIYHNIGFLEYTFILLKSLQQNILLLLHIRNCRLMKPDITKSTYL